jgi:catechol 2,3-dioxygenase-like lactoylglutathione lyase family enzyme
MKRFHVHVAVEDLEANIRFYSTLFGTAPAVRKPDYAKWMLDDPRINFALSRRGDPPGINHLGIQVESDEQLDAMRANLAQAAEPVLDQRATKCCYVQSNKHWVQDPQGIAWETFHTLSEIAFFADASHEHAEDIPAKPRACCAPQAKQP